MRTVKALAYREGLSSLQRPRFSPGLLLEDEDLTAGVDYTREMMRLLFRSLFGCGVICGLDVTAALICHRRQLKVTIGGGLALDCAGNPIHIARTETFTFDPDCKPIPPTIWVTVCYAEKACRPRDVSCASDDDGQVVHTRSRDAYEIKLYDEQPECACSCEKPKPKYPPKPRDYGGCCDDDREAAPDPASAAATVPGTADDDATEGGSTADDNCACYEDHNKGVCDCACGCHCVVIAILDTTKDPSGATIDLNLSSEIEVQVSTSMRRWIRPVLTGYLPCLEPKRPDRAADYRSEPSAGRTE